MAEFIHFGEPLLSYVGMHYIILYYIILYYISRQLLSQNKG